MVVVVAVMVARMFGSCSSSRVCEVVLVVVVLVLVVVLGV